MIAEIITHVMGCIGFAIIEISLRAMYMRGSLICEGARGDV